MNAKVASFFDLFQKVYPPNDDKTTVKLCDEQILCPILETYPDAKEVFITDCVITDINFLKGVKKIFLNYTKRLATSDILQFQKDRDTYIEVTVAEQFPDFLYGFSKINTLKCTRTFLYNFIGEIANLHVFENGVLTPVRVTTIPKTCCFDKVCYTVSGLNSQDSFERVAQEYQLAMTYFPELCSLLPITMVDYVSEKTAGGLNSNYTQVFTLEWSN